MKSLYLENTEDSPEIFFNADSGQLLIQGRSFMEDATPFHHAMINWLRGYFKDPNEKTVLELELDYINTSSTKMLIDILSELNKFYIFGNDVLVIWKYDRYDEDMQDMGTELREMVEFPIEFAVLV